MVAEISGKPQVVRTPISSNRAQEDYKDGQEIMDRLQAIGKSCNSPYICERIRNATHVTDNFHIGNIVTATYKSGKTVHGEIVGFYLDSNLAIVVGVRSDNSIVDVNMDPTIKLSLRPNITVLGPGNLELTLPNLPPAVDDQLLTLTKVRQS